MALHGPPRLNLKDAPLVTFGRACLKGCVFISAFSANVRNLQDPSRQYLLQQKARGDFQVSNSAGQLLRIRLSRSQSFPFFAFVPCLQWPTSCMFKGSCQWLAATMQLTIRSLVRRGFGLTVGLAMPQDQLLAFADPPQREADQVAPRLQRHTLAGHACHEYCTVPTRSRTKWRDQLIILPMQLALHET